MLDIINKNWRKSQLKVAYTFYSKMIYFCYMNLKIKLNNFKKRVMEKQIKLCNGKVKKVIGTQLSKVNGRLLLRVAGDELYDLNYATTINGEPLTPEMFLQPKTKNDKIQEIQEVLMWCNGWNAPKNDGVWSDLLAEIQIKAEGLEGVGENYGKTKESNKFVADVCKSVRRYYKCSEKQAYIIAKYAFEQGIKFDG